MTAHDLLVALLMVVGAITLGWLAPRVVELVARRASSPWVGVALWGGWLLACEVVVVVGAALAGRSVDGRSGAVLACAVAVAVPSASCLRVAVEIARTRRRHRATLALVGTYESDLDAWVVESPWLAAWCVPGRQCAVVLTREVLLRAGPDELRAVLAHERAHLDGSSRRVVDSMSVWVSAVPWLPGRDRAKPALALAREMLADDVAARSVGSLATLAALHRLQPSTQASAGEWQPDARTLQRVRRLLGQPASGVGFPRSST